MNYLVILRSRALARQYLGLVPSAVASWRHYDLTGAGRRGARRLRKMTAPKSLEMYGRAALAFVLLVSLLVLLPPRAEAAVSTGDGILTYGVAGSTTPQSRAYGVGGNSFSTAAAAAAGGTGAHFMTRTSPKRVEAVTGYVDTAGVLRVMCYNGSTWSNEWSVTVGGTATTRRFDIAYETNSGDVVVLYGTDAATTNELAYRTKSGTTGCGAAQW